MQCLICQFVHIIKQVKQDQKSIDAILKRPNDLQLLMQNALLIFDSNLQTNISQTS